MGTGTLDIEGTSAGALSGDANDLIEFQTYRAQRVGVDWVAPFMGTLNVSGENAFGTGCAGIAGIQVLPEPATGLAVALGGGFLAGCARRRRARASRR